MRLTWRQTDCKRIDLRQNKTGVHVSVRLPAPAKTVLDDAWAALAEVPASDARTLVTARDGHRSTEDCFRASRAKVKRDDVKIAGGPFTTSVARL